MRLLFQDPPRAGTHFRLTITNSDGIAHTTWLLDGDLVKTTECDDPPCYDEMYIEPAWEGREIHIVSSDNRETKELRFRVGGTNLAPAATSGAQRAR
jgi:hypothetical protein